MPIELETFKAPEVTDSSESILGSSSGRGRRRFYGGRGGGGRRSGKMMFSLPGLAAPKFRLRLSSNDI